MKVRFPVLIKYPKQMDSLMQFLKDKGYRWASGREVIDWRNTMNNIPSKSRPCWILLGHRGSGKNCISYYYTEEGESSSEKSVCDWCCYTPREVEFED